MRSIYLLLCSFIIIHLSNAQASITPTTGTLICPGQTYVFNVTITGTNKSAGPISAIPGDPHPITVTTGIYIPPNDFTNV